MKAKKGSLEGPAKAKSRIKKFESCLEYNHRLALTYASNTPGTVPRMPGFGTEGGPWEPPDPTPPDENDIEPGPRNPAARGRR